MIVVGLCICLFFIWLFALAAYHKFANLNYYSKLMSNYGLSVLPVQKAAVTGLALLEGGVAIMLIIPALRTVALFIGIGLLFLYATAMTMQLIVGHRQLNCGCAGQASNTHISVILVARNVFLILLAVVAVIGGAGVIFTSFTAILIMTMTAFMILLYLCVEQLISNGQTLSTLKVF